MGEAKRRKTLDPNFGKVSNGKLNNPTLRDYYPLWTLGCASDKCGIDNQVIPSPLFLS